ncbi:glycosyltransferase [Pseudotabrizicola alkalilacus]|uniref:Glycosyltransferase n=1 Tax=Pseudotabrizicola alkalilacus TaxID=2305252 RepID=A0A411Z637_9RHOB|nr:glycosyltransferase [Pseudotabrizicola alkalilacus]RGP38497.1 glycosyltransferase [Pseudotabrizicola alkalilacus]
MKILYVNWVDYLDPEGRGGGVSLYQRNLMRALSGVAGVEASFLACGTSYDPLRPNPRWEVMRHGPRQDRQRRFDLVNSGTLAPGHASFGQATQVSHPATEAVFFDFLARTGPYDVIHFNNLEGIPVDVLRLKDRFPASRLVLSLHNYYPFCPQVNFWQDEARNCVDDEQGRRCVTCLPQSWNPAQIRAGHGLAYRMKVLGIPPDSWVFRQTFRVIFGLGRRLGRLRGQRKRQTLLAGSRQADAALALAGMAFVKRRAAMVQQRINTHCDLVLCVSDRVRQIALREGVRPEKAVTNYIGTVEAQNYAAAPERGPILRPDGTVKLAYFGYMRRDKGFYFLLDALEALPDADLCRLHLVVAARRGAAEVMARLAALAPRLAGFEHQDGYGHGDLDRLLADVGVGLLPVMWEDNLPQVAIELHARRIPLLCSDLGGARELGNSPAFVFRAGDVGAFGGRIRAILSGEIGAEDYWRAAIVPETMSAHVEKLLALYRG